MAGTWKDFVEGELVSETELQNIQDSIVFIYSSESAANTALTSKVDGTLFYDTTANAVKVWNGSSWDEVGGGGGGITEADQYQINSDISSDTDPITTLVRPSGTLQAYLGTGMSQSSGTWTFPSTGYYEIFLYGRLKITDFGHSGYYVVKASDDDFSSSDQILALRVEVDNGDRVNIAGKTIVKITNTSNDKVRISFDEVSDAVLEGSSADMVSGVIFTKLGDL
jgi:hypothetical protein